MQSFFVFGGIRGYHRLMRSLDYLNHPQREEIEWRVKVIKFFDRYGAEATREAFGVAPSTVYLWKKRLRESQGRLVALASRSRAPIRRRKRKVSPEIVKFIEDYRGEHPGVGKGTIKPALDDFCRQRGLRTVSESTVGRIISDLREQGKLPLRRGFSLQGRTGKLVERRARPYRVKLRRKGYRPRKPGDLVQMDAICLFDNGIKRYIISAIDLKTRFAFAWCYRRLTSLSAKDLLAKFLSLAPFAVRRVQTDNGSEFEHHFHRFLKEQNILHYFNYPRHPQSNAHIERFQRTLQEQYVNWSEYEPHDTKPFNHGLVHWLLWYNTQKPHHSLGRLPPLRYYLDAFINNPYQSNMLWTHTCPLQLQSQDV